MISESNLLIVGLVGETLPPLGPRGETHSLAGEGVGDPILTKGQTLWYSRVYTIVAVYPIAWSTVVSRQGNYVLLLHD